MSSVTSQPSPNPPPANSPTLNQRATVSFLYNSPSLSGSVFVQSVWTKMTVNICDSNGNILVSGTVPNGGWDITLSLGSVSSPITGFFQFLQNPDWLHSPTDNPIVYQSPICIINSGDFWNFNSGHRYREMPIERQGIAKVDGVYNLVTSADVRRLFEEGRDVELSGTGNDWA